MEIAKSNPLRRRPMPLETCPFDEETIAKYALGEVRSYMSAEEYARVGEHVKSCKYCGAKAETYKLPANDPKYRKLAPNAKEEIIVSAQNVWTRFSARMQDESKREVRKDLFRRWRFRVLAMLAAAILLTSLVFRFIRFSGG